jgi:tetratricopeptide (TPR) repeat protein
MMRTLLITLIVVSAPCAALAQIDQDWKYCNAEGPDDATVSACTRLIETDELSSDDRAIAYYHRGAAYWRKGDYDKGLADESNAIEINPEFADAYMTRGAFFVDTGDYDRAIAETSRAISIDPRNVRAYSNRAFARGRKGDFAGAIADTTKAIEIDPRWIAAYIVRGDNYARKGDHGMAFADFGKVAQIDPKSGEELSAQRNGVRTQGRR